MHLDITDGVIEWYDGPEWDEVAQKAFEDAAQNVKSYAQNNAPWEDRTGDARRRLDTDVELRDQVVTLALGHGVEYGYWLEVIQNGRFAIIQQTLQLYAPVVISATIARLRSARQGKRYS